MLSLGYPCRLDNRSSSNRLPMAVQLLVCSSSSSSSSTSMLGWTAQQQLLQQQGRQQQLQLAQGCMQGVLTLLRYTANTASTSCSWEALGCHTCQLEVLQAFMECLHQP
jgi:hypothetical protein